MRTERRWRRRVWKDWRLCYYCAVHLTPPPPEAPHRAESTTRTADHLFPKKSDPALDPPYRVYGALNVVPACNTCNQTKGRQPPLTFLLTLPTLPPVLRTFLTRWCPELLEEYHLGRARVAQSACTETFAESAADEGDQS